MKKLRLIDVKNQCFPVFYCSAMLNFKQSSIDICGLNCIIKSTFTMKNTSIFRSHMTNKAKTRRQKLWNIIVDVQKKMKKIMYKKIQTNGVKNLMRYFYKCTKSLSSNKVISRVSSHRDWKKTITRTIINLKLFGE